jgi:HEAT repeat protein
MAIEWPSLLEFPQAGVPRPARVDTIRDREEARRLAELAREQAALQRELQMQLNRDQAEMQRVQQELQRQLQMDWNREQQELQREIAREQAEIQRALAREQAEQVRWNAEIDRTRSLVWSTEAASSFSLKAPAPWAGGQDVGDSVYRAARELLNRGEWGQAAAYFRNLPQRFPNSAYAAEAGYYQAFALYRIGETAGLREALAALDAQRAKYPNARSRGDASALATRILGVLASRGDTQAQAQLQAISSDQGATCDKEEQAVQAEAMNALSRSDAANVNDLITRVLARRDECAIPLRRTAVFLVGNRRDAQAVTILAGVARNDPSVDVRVEAVNVIGRLSSEDGVPVLEEMARADDERVQRAAIRALVRHPSARARQSVRTLVERDETSERLRSEALSAFNTDRATADDITWLKTLYARFESPTLKSRTLSAIVRVGGPDVDQWLVSIASSETERSDLRATAMRRIGASMSIADLGRLYDGATQQRFRQEIISVLGKRTEDAATDKLIAIVKTGTDPSLRRSAISALAGKNDPRATQLLLEIINK